MRDLEEPLPSLRGQLLVAHPALQDPNFARSVILLSEHSGEDGAVGVILNRPLGQTLGAVRTEFAGTPLSEVPVFQGGPVEADQIILTAWRWNAEACTFELYFGVASEVVEELREQDAAYEVRAFLGYSGWGGGQLESELAESAWIVGPIIEEELDRERLPPLWRELLGRLRPELGFLADAPDDPSLN